MLTILLKSFTAIGLKLIASLGTREVLEWVLWKGADMYVKSTKTPDDDEFIEELRKRYEAKE